MEGPEELQNARRPFAAVIQEQRSGLLHSELSHELASLVSAVLSTGKAGTLTLAVKVTPNKDGVTVMVTDKVTVKMPEGERGAAVFFVQGDGNLVRRDPRQLEMPLREVSREGDLRDAGGA